MLYEPSSPTAVRHIGLVANPPPLTPYRGVPLSRMSGSAAISGAGATPGVTSPQALAALAVAAAAVGGSGAVSGAGRHHYPVPPLWDQALEQEKRLRAELRKKSFWDPDVRRLRAALQGTYEALLFGHYDFACTHEVEPNLWKAVFYKPIEEFRSRIRALESLVRGGTAPSTPVVSPTSGAGGASPSVPVQLATPEEARAQLGRTTAAYMRFLDEALAFYRKLVWKLQWVHGNVGAVVDLDAALQMEIQDCVPRASAPRAPEARQSVHRCLIYLGDLCRYQSMALKDRPASARPLWERAMSYYRQGARVLPASGNPYNQMAVMSYYTNDELRAVYYYFRSLAVSMPFVTARENLLLLFEKNRNRYGNIAALQGGHEADLRAAAGHVADVSVRFVRLHGMLFDKINLHQFSEVLTAAMHDLETMLDHPGCRAILQKAPEADQLLFHLAIMNIFSVHNVTACGNAAGVDFGGGASYAAAAKRAELMCHSLTAAMRFAAVVTGAAASMASAAAAGCGVGDVETGFGAVSTACHVMLNWIVSNPEVISPKLAGTTSGSGSASGNAEVPPEVAAEVTARCAFLAAAARLAAHLSDLTRRRAHDQDWQDPAVRHRSLPEDSELVGFGPLIPVVSVAAAWPAPSEAPGEVAVFAVRVARMLQALRHLDDALGPGLLWSAAATSGSPACNPPQLHSPMVSASPWHSPAASVAMPPPGSALAQELSRAVRGFRSAVVRATTMHIGPQANLQSSGSGGANVAGCGSHAYPHSHKQAPALTGSGDGDSDNGHYRQKQLQQQQQEQRLAPGYQQQVMPNGGAHDHALPQRQQLEHHGLQSHSATHAAGAMQSGYTGGLAGKVDDMSAAAHATALSVQGRQKQQPPSSPPPPPPLPRILIGGAIGTTIPPLAPTLAQESRQECLNSPQPQGSNSDSPVAAAATAWNSTAARVGNDNGKVDTNDDVVEDEIVYQPPRLPRPTSMSNGLHQLHQKNISGGGAMNGMPHLQDNKSVYLKQLSGGSAAAGSLLPSRETSRDGSAFLWSASVLSASDFQASAGAMPVGAPTAVAQTNAQELSVNVGNVAGAEALHGGRQPSSSGLTSPASTQGGTLPPSPKQQFPLQYSQLPSQAPSLLQPPLSYQHQAYQQPVQGRGDLLASRSCGGGGSGTGMGPAPATVPTPLPGRVNSDEKVVRPMSPSAEELPGATTIGHQQKLLLGGGTGSGSSNALTSVIPVGGRRVSAGNATGPVGSLTAPGGFASSISAAAGGIIDRPGSSGGMALWRPPSAGTMSSSSGGAAAPQGASFMVAGAPKSQPHSPKAQQLDNPSHPQHLILLHGLDVSIPQSTVGAASALFAGLPTSLRQRAQQHQYQQTGNQAGVPGLPLLTSADQPQRPSAAASAAGLGFGQGPGPGQGLTAPLGLPSATFSQANGAMPFSVGADGGNTAFAGLPMQLAAPRLTGSAVPTVAAGSNGGVALCPPANGQLGWPASGMTGTGGAGAGLDVSSLFAVATGNYQSAAIAEATAEATAVAMADELLQDMEEVEASGRDRNGGVGGNGYGMFRVGGGGSTLYGGGGDDFLDADRFSPAVAAAAAIGAPGGVAPVTREHSAGSDALFLTGLSGNSPSAGGVTATGMPAFRSSGSGSGGFGTAAVASAMAMSPGGCFQTSGDGAGAANIDVGMAWQGAGNLEGFGSWGVVSAALPEHMRDYHHVLRQSKCTEMTAGMVTPPQSPPPHPDKQAQGPPWQVQHEAGAAVSAVEPAVGTGNGGLFGEDLSCLSFLAAQLQQPMLHLQGQLQGQTWGEEIQGCHQGPSGPQG